MTTLVILGLIGVFAALGFVRGVARVAGLVVATFVAILIAPALGRGLEGLVASMTGTGGLRARLIAIMVAGLVVIVVVSVAVNFAMKAWVKRQPGVKRWDRWAGLGLGGLEGLLIALLVVWVPLTLEPVAKAIVESGGGDDTTRRILSAAEGVRGSALGGIATSTNPLAENDLMKLAGDFAVISRDQAKLERFMATDAMKRIQALPSINQAIDMIEKDPELRQLTEGGRGVSVQAIFKILDNPTVLKVLDQTTVVADLTPLAGDLQAAVKQTREGK